MNEFPTLLDLLRSRAAEHPDRELYRFAGDAGEAVLSYGQLLDAACGVASRLQRSGLEGGERALLLYPPDLGFITAFFGCLAAGVIPVPCPPPNPNRTNERLNALAEDCRPRFVLTTSGLLKRRSAFAAGAPAVAQAEWIATNESPDDAAGWREPVLSPESIAFLQYTSGSTSTPKGVVVTHRNLLCNEEMIRQAFGMSRESVVVSWLPLYHDMGLIGGVLQPLYAGGRCVLMTPHRFLQQPVRWLEAISRHGATVSGGPDFAYDLCAKRVTAVQKENLDLSRWTCAFSGAEPVRAETLERFAEAFSACGFRPEHFYPCYGLAEATLFVSGGPRGRAPVVRALDAAALEQHRVVTDPAGSRRLVSCGGPWPGGRAVIAEPETGALSPDGCVGEIWVAGEHVAQGYWGRSGDEAGFGARLADGDGPFLRTGDLGFLEGSELYVTGRLKDLVIIRGRNHYPQDIEATVANSHPLLRPGGCAVFSVEAASGESLVIVQEVVPHVPEDLSEVLATVHRVVVAEHDVTAAEVVLIRAGTLLKTSSGKVRRSACRAAYLQGDLAVVARSAGSAVSGPAAGGPRLGLTRKELLAVDLTERRLLLERSLNELVAGRLAVPSAAVDSKVPLTSLGLDSLAAAEVRSEIEASLGIRLSAAVPLAPSLEQLAEEIALHLVTTSEPGGPVSTPEPDSGELSHGQQALLYLHHLAPDSAAYHIGYAARASSTIEAPVLRQALAVLAARHGILRTVFVTDAGGSRRQVVDGLQIDLREEAAPDAPALLAERVDQEIERPFNLESSPPARALLLRGGAGGDLLVLTVHHIAADFWSLSTLLEELSRLYTAAVRGEDAGLPSLPLDYGDYVRWQRGLLAGPQGQRLSEFWLTQLTGDLPVLDLPLDRPRPPQPTHAGAAELMTVEPPLAWRLAEVGRSETATPFTVLLATFFTLLHRYSGQRDLLVGTPTSGRSERSLEPLVGYFVNPVVVRAELGNDPSFRQLLRRVREQLTAALLHDGYPFPLLAERLPIARDGSRSPVFQAMAVLLKSRAGTAEDLPGFALGEPEACLELGDLTLSPFPRQPRASQVDLTLEAAEWRGRLAMRCVFNPDLFDATTVRRMLAHLHALFLGAAAEPEGRISEIPLLDPMERHQLLHEWGETAPADLADAVTVHQLFEAQAGRTPDRVAVRHGSAALTYRELDSAANRLAHRLRRSGVGTEAPVAVAMERDFDLVTALLAVFKAGGAYVPLDPSYPSERLQGMLDDSGARLLLTQERLSGTLPASGVAVLAVDREAALWQVESDEPPAPCALPGNLAYVIYTSGSTGRPKGVAIEHRSTAARLFWARRAYTAAELAGVLAATSVCFDLSVFEIFAPLVSGGTVILAENALALPRLEAASEVTLINTVPSAMAELARLESIPAATGTINLAGEALRRSLVDLLHTAVPDLTLHNLYGPTEDTTYSLGCRIDPPAAGDSREIPIGRPLPGTRALVLGPGFELLPPGVAGELFLGGAGLARGYLGRPELTAERFVPDPFGGPGSRLYRTGDLVRQRADGSFDYLGRGDHQVKIRGFRIEIGEIEHHLLTHPAVRECVVLARPGAAGDLRLIAYVAGDGILAAENELRSFLRQKLPEHMVPGAVVLLTALPRTVNGKVDRAALPLPRPAVAAVARPPQGPVEELIAEIWAGLLGFEGAGQISAEESFFDLGGHSLLATQALARLRVAFGVDLPLRALFETSSVTALARRIESLVQGAPGRVPPEVSFPAPLSLGGLRHQGVTPLSFAQERLWFLAQLLPDSAAYNMPGALRLRGELNIGALAGALAGIARRHEILRSTFPLVDGQPVQRVESPQPGLSFVDLGSLPADRRDGERWRIEQEEARRPFDLTHGPLLRTVLLGLEPGRFDLLFGIHHMVGDGWSMTLILRELSALYSAAVLGREPVLSNPPVQYSDVAVWQRGWLDGETLDRGIGFWREHLRGFPAVLELPTDRPRPSVRRMQGHLCSFVLPAELVNALRQLARREGTTLFMALLSGWAALVHRMTGEDRFVLASPVANRQRVELEGVVGLLVNLLPIAVDAAGAPDFSALLVRLREEVLTVHLHQEIPFEKLVEALEPSRDLSHPPLVQTLLALQPPLPPPDLPGLRAELNELGTGTAKLDLSVLLTEEPGGVAGFMEADSDLYDRTTVARLIEQFETLLAAAVAHPGALLSQLQVLPGHARQQLLAEWNEPVAASLDAESSLTIDRCFAARAASHPEAVAVIFGDLRLTYGELDRRADGLAHRLRRLGAGPGTLVAVFLERGLELVVSLLGVLKSGAAYLPLDPHQPRERLGFMLADAGAPLLVTEEMLVPSLPASGCRIVLLSGDDGAGEEGPPPSLARGEDLAYVIYTSGSTGRPKGVEVEHRQVVRLFQTSESWGRFSEADTWTLFHSYAFDFSVWEIWGALLYGGRLVIVPYWTSRSPETFLRLLADQGVTVLNQTPSVFYQLIAAEESLAEDRAPLALRLVIFGGEALDPTRLAPWFERHGDHQPLLVNMYGITETTVHVTFRPLSAADLHPARGSAIGRPLADLTVHLLDAHLEPVPIGVPGEILVGGCGVARGYRDRPELTASRFLPDPFNGLPGARLYRSGDLARRLPSGEIEYLGRIDHQIKIRGHRIELGEIEAMLLEHPAVRQAAVAARARPGDPDRHLVAYLMAPADTAPPAPSELRSFVAGRLPSYMVPATFVLVNEFPLTPNGKVDRRALLARMPDRQDSEMAAPGFAPPRGPLEELLAGIWKSLLAVDQVGSDDDFFALGGHSLLAARLATRVRETFGVDLPLQVFFESTTLASMGTRITAALQSTAPEDGGPPPLKRVPRDAPLPLSFAQERLWLLDRLEPGNPAYNIVLVTLLEGRLETGLLRRSLAALVERHEILRTTFTMIDGEPRQVIAPASGATASLPEIDLRQLPSAVSGRELNALADAEARWPFNLARGPLLRLSLVRGETRDALLLNMHHAISDGWSMGILLSELADIYGMLAAGMPVALPELPVQYADFAVWQRGWLDSAATEVQLDYWRQQLDGASFTLDLPTDWPRQASGSDRAERLTAVIPAELADGLRQLSRDRGTTLFMVLLAAFAVLLHRLSGQRDVIVGSPVAGREHSSLEALIGIFLNSLPLRLDLTDGPSFASLLEGVREVCLGAFARQEVPFEAILSALNVERDLTRTPLFQAFFNMLTFPVPRITLPGARVRETAWPQPVAKFDLSLYARETDGPVRFDLVFNAGLFSTARAAEMLGQWVVLLQQVTEAPERPVDSYSLLTESARRVLPDPRAPLSNRWHGAVHTLFAGLARRHPGRMAVADASETWSYGDLDRRANQLASHLLANGLRRGETVAIYAHRSAALVWGILGVLKAGGATLLLDPGYPASRLGQILRIATPRAWLQATAAGEPGPELAAALDELPLRCRVALRPRLEHSASSDPLAGAADTDPGLPVGPDDLACVTFTSGSTGIPKGVLGRHGSLTHFLPFLARRFDLDETDRFAMVSALAHDPLQRDIFTPLCLGATLHVPAMDDIEIPGRLAEWVCAHRVTVLHLTPALGQILTLAADAGLPAHRQLADLRLTFFVGETLSRHTVRALRRLAPKVLCVNLYGSTETQRAVGYHVVEGDETPGAVSESLPLGAGMEDVQLLVLGTDGVLAGIGELGEIHVRSPHLALGYLDDEELTRQRFLASPFTQATGDRLYRTGDLGRYLPNGSVEFEGRLDHQIKIRGFRVETGEIEHVIHGHPGVREVAVVAHETASEQRLAAYVVAYPGANLTAAALRQMVADRLPSYMVPADVVFLDELPLTPNKKVDRKALQLPPAASSPASRELLRSPQEEVIAPIWEQLLGRQGIGHDSHFFELGGNSLLATRMLARLQSSFAVHLPLRAVFETPTLAGLAGRLTAAQGLVSTPQRMPLAPVPRDGDLWLSFAQQRLWFLEQLDPGSPAYHLPAELRIQGPLSAAFLERAFEVAAGRHEILRTSFPEVAGTPRQRISPPSPLPLPRIDLTSLPPSQREAEARRLARLFASQPFDLGAHPAWRAALVRLGEEDHILLLTLHHIAADGWSVGVLMSELQESYAALSARRSPLRPPLPIQYADYAMAQRQWLEGERLNSLLAYWKEALAGDLPVLALPVDRPRRPLASAAGAREPIAFSLELTARLAALSRERDATLFMTLLAGFAALLFRLTHQTDTLIGSPIANRPAVELEDLIGLFANTLVLRMDLTGDLSFATALDRARQTAFGAFAHQDVPFEKIVEELRPDRDLSVNPLFQVMLSLQNAPMPVLELDGLDTTAAEAAERAARFDWTLTLSHTGERLAGSLEYKTELFDDDTVRRVLDRFTTLLESIVLDPSAPLSSLALMPAVERVQILVEWNATARAYPEDDCLHHLIARQAARTPTAVAVAGDGRELTYAELDRMANRLAGHLRRLGAGPEVLVGVAVDPGPDTLVTLLAILKAGGAYLPLDPSYPGERLAMMLEDAAALLIVTQDHLRARLPLASARLVCLESDRALIEGLPSTPVDGGAVAQNLAYVLFTSGTTGRPKGVQVSHRSLVNFLCSMQREPGISATDTLLAVTSLGFDIAGLELFLPLLVGARVVTVDRDTAVDGGRLLAAAQACRATVMQATPATWRLLLAAGWQGPGPRVLCGGEALPEDLAAQLSQRAAEVWNLYGPTETTVWSSLAPLSPASPVTLGRPIANTSIRLLGPGLELVPAGVVGEIYIGGTGVARGYARRPDLTAERFLPDPWSSEPGARLYRTGDLGRYRPDGQIDFLGRRDHQVKVRGFRIELAEIETALVSYPAVRQVVVVSRGDGQEAKLVAYLTTAATNPGAEELRQHLRRRLPEFMIPTAFVVLDSLPLTPNGKIDRKALPEPSAAPGVPTASVLGMVAELLAGIWGEVLGTPPPPADADFFALGGHSLLATRIVSRVHEVFGVDLPVRALFETPGLADLARRIEELRRRGTAGALPPIERTPRDLPLPISLAQERLWFLYAYDPEGSSAYNIPSAVQLDGDLSAATLAQAVTELTHRHEVLRTTFRAEGDHLTQVIAAPGPVAVPTVDLSGLPGARRERERTRLVDEEAAHPFVLDREPAWRIRLLWLAEREHVLLLTVHHIAADGRSVALLTRDLLEIYTALEAGHPLRRPEPTLQYADFAQWQRRHEDAPAMAAELDYWTARLKDAPRALNLPIDKPRPAEPGSAGIHEPLSLSPAMSEALRGLGREHGSSLFMAVLAAVAVLLHVHTDAEDILVGAPIDVRDHLAVEDVAGLFLNMLVLRMDLSGNPSVREVLRRVRDTVLEAHDHRHVPFSRVIQALRPERGAGETPLFQIAYTMQAPPPLPPLPPGLAMRPLPVHSGRIPFDLNLNFVASQDGVEGLFGFRSDLFTPVTAARMTADLRALLQHISHHPEQRLDEIRRQFAHADEHRWVQERTGLRQAASRRFGAAQRRVAVTVPPQTMDSQPSETLAPEWEEKR